MIRLPRKLCVGALGISLALFLLSLLLFGIFALIFGGGNRYEYSNPELLENIGVFLVVLAIGTGVVYLIMQVIVTFLVIWRMWASIQDGHARTTPGKAVGFLFIPFFNLYWVCQVWGGFPKDYNSYVERYQLHLPPLKPGLYVAYPTLMLLSVIPFVGIAVAVIAPFVFLAVSARTCDAVNRLADALQHQPPPGGRLGIAGSPIPGVNWQTNR